MTALHVLTGELISLQKMAEDEEIPMDALKDTMEALKIGVEDKAKALATLSSNMDADIAALDSEIDRLSYRKKSIASRKDALIEYIRLNMEAGGIKKISCPIFTITHVDGSEIVFVEDETKIPDDYMVVKVESRPDKVMIKKALKDGEIIPGCRLEKGKSSIRIK